jgi:cytochrome P450
LRKVVSHDFTPRAISRLEDRLRRIAADYLDEVADQQDVDFVASVAHPIPAAIALALLGVPKEDWTRLADLEHMTLAGIDPERVPEGKDPESVAREATQEVFAYFRALTDERRANPSDDLISQFVNGVVQGEPLSRAYAAIEAGVFLNGGLDTTRAAASAGAMLPLLERPDQLARLGADPAVLTTAVDEFVRWGSPITQLARTVTAPTTIRNVDLHEGDRVVVFPASANRDDALFPEPFRYDITRRPNKHIGFGFGEHYCLGAHLARLSLKIMFEQIVTRFKMIELAGDPARVRSNFLGGLKHLPVHMVPV